MSSNNMVRLSGDEIRQHITDSLNTPFVETLTKFMVNQPSSKAIKAHAEQSPERWVQSVMMLARLAGYSEKQRPVQVNQFFTQVTAMSDGEVRDQLAEVISQMERIKAEAGEVVPAVIEDAEFVEIEAEDDARKAFGGE